MSFLEGKPEIVHGLQPVTVKVGEKVTLEVETKGPVKQVKWLENYCMLVTVILFKSKL